METIIQTTPGIEAIRVIARAGHIGQTRFDKETPHFDHSEHLEAELAKKGAPEIQRMLALTHDLFEENKEDIQTFKRLIRRALPKTKAEILIKKTERMTHHPLTDYKTYIYQLSTDEDCVEVKIEDIRHNQQGRPSRAKKALYEWAIQTLTGQQECPAE
jgi:hypothetical protein